jgi:hypothetical protein
MCAVLSAAAKWIHSVISVTPTGLTHFIDGAPAALSGVVHWATTGQWDTTVISDEAAGAFHRGLQLHAGLHHHGHGRVLLIFGAITSGYFVWGRCILPPHPGLRGRHLHRLAHRVLRDAALHGHHRRRRRLAHGSGRPGCLSALTIFLCELAFYGGSV